MSNSDLTNKRDSFNLSVMFKKTKIPPSFSLIKKGKTFLLLHNHYQETLLELGIEEIESFLSKHLSITKYLNGRTPHPSIPLQDGQRMVIRKYSHGGFLRYFNRDLFIFGARSFNELFLTEQIRSSGIPTIQPIGAIHQNIVWPFYRAYLLSLEISNTKDLIQYFQEIGRPGSPETLLHKRNTINAAGLLLRKFHRAGFCHNDLQLKNLLVLQDGVLIIDFDRSYRRDKLSTRERISNLLRLNRSVEKRKRLGLPITRTDRWRFLVAYAGEDKKILHATRKALWVHSVNLLFHRIGWAFGKIVRS